jgi:hypothetical protein
VLPVLKFRTGIAPVAAASNSSETKASAHAFGELMIATNKVICSHSIISPACVIGFGRSLPARHRRQLRCPAALYRR